MNISCYLSSRGSKVVWSSKIEIISFASHQEKFGDFWILIEGLGT